MVNVIQPQPVEVVDQAEVVQPQPEEVVEQVEIIPVQPEAVAEQEEEFQENLDDRTLVQKSPQSRFNENGNINKTMERQLPARQSKSAAPAVAL